MTQRQQALREMASLGNEELLFWLRKYLRLLDPSPLRSSVFLRHPDVALQSALAANPEGLGSSVSSEVESFIRNRLPAALARLLREWSLMEGVEYLVRLLRISGLLVVESATDPMLQLLESNAFQDVLRLRPDAKALVLANLLDIADRTGDEELQEQLRGLYSTWIREPHCAALCYQELVRDDPNQWLRYLPELVNAKVMFPELKLWTVLDDLFRAHTKLLTGRHMASILETLLDFGKDSGAENLCVEILRAFTEALPLMDVYLQLVPAPIAFRRIEPRKQAHGIHFYNARRDAHESYCHIGPEMVPQLWQFLMSHRAADALSMLKMVTGLTAGTLLQLTRKRKLAWRMI